MPERSCLIIGASHAAAELATSLRKEGWEGRINVISDEHSWPYHRPTLSKAFLAGEKSIEEILIRKPAVYEKMNIHFTLGVRVDGIDRNAKTVQLDNGESLHYDKLALTVGSRVRKVSLPGSSLEGIFYLRDINDVEQIKTFLGIGKKAVIVGGGYIGLETAAGLRKLSMDVTVLEMMPRVLQRVTAPEVSEFYTRVHSEEGVKIVTGVAVEAFKGSRQVESVICQDGSSYEADLVVVGVGVEPNVELADSAGLEVNNGIVVDESATTNDFDILAAGDCTNHYNPIYERRLRLESVQNAVDQAKVAAATICGIDKSYSALPWFWSDQYDLKLQIAGLSQEYDDVVIRGDIKNSRSFTAFYFKENVVIAVDAVNRPQEFMLGKRLIVAKSKIDKIRLEDDSVAMKDIAAVS